MRDNRWKEDDSRIWDEDASGPGGRGYGQRGRGDQGRFRGDEDRFGPQARGGYGPDVERDRGGQLGQGRHDHDPDFGRRSIGGGYGQGGYGQSGYGQGGYEQRGSYDPGRQGYGDADRTDYGGAGRGNAGYGGPDYGNTGYGRQRWTGRDDGRFGERGGRERGWWDRATDEVASWMGDEDAERRRSMDEARAGHQGRGPRGYTRSDDRIREDVNDRLTDDYRIDAGDVEVSVSNGEVTLNGTVRSRDEKRRAEDVAESVSGVKHVQNNVRVQQGGTPSASSDAGTAAAGNAAASSGKSTPMNATTPRSPA